MRVFQALRTASFLTRPGAANIFTGVFRLPTMTPRMFPKSASLLALCGMLLLPGALLGDATPAVPPSHPVYAFLERAEARGYLNHRLSGIRPLSRATIARHLASVREHSLSPADHTELGRHVLEFFDELLALGGSSTSKAVLSKWASLVSGNLIRFKEGDGSIVADPVLRQSYVRLSGTATPNENTSITRIGLALRGTKGEHVGFRVQHFEARERSSRARGGREDVLSRPIEEVQFKGKTVDFREARFQMLWANDWLTLDAGKDSFGWGPSPHTNLFLRAASPSYYYGRVEVAYRAIRFAHFFGALSARPGAIDTARTTTSNGHSRRFKPAKRISAHRLELTMGRFLIGLQESVVYGDRGFELAYLAPPTVFVGAQSYLDDTDNLAVGIDASALIPYKTKIYASLFFDDLKKFSPGDFATKTARQIGFHTADPFNLSNVDAWFEYTRIDPFVYTHLFDINAYEHFDDPLGHPLGPNTDQILMMATWRPMGTLNVSLGFVRVRTGENVRTSTGELTNVGGDLQLGQRPTDPFTKTFLDGQRTTNTDLTVGVRVEPTKNLVFDVRWGWQRTRIVGFEADGRRLDADLHLHAF